MNTSMLRRPMGNSGLMVSALGMGCSRLGSVRRDLSGKSSRAAVTAALDSGITFFDTADSYGGGRSERILGEAVARDRDQVVIATKCGMLRTPAALLRAIESTRKRAGGGGRISRGEGPWRLLQTSRCYSPSYIVRAAEASLRRLGTEYLDILLLHSPPPAVLTEGGVRDAMDKLKADGKIRLWGVSARTEADAELATAIPGIECIEVKLNVCHSESLRGSIEQASKQGLGVIARQPFDSGRVIQNLAADIEFVGRGLSGAGSKLRLCLQFALGVLGVSTVLAGMTRPEHVRANVSASMGEPVNLSDLERLREYACGH